MRFLTDPTFDPASGGYTTGTVTLKKLRGPGLSEEEVGRFDYVLLTHDHTSTTLIVQAGRFCRRRKRCSQLAKARSGSSIDVQAPECGVLQNRCYPGAVCGLVLSFADSPESADCVSGDTVW